MKSFYIGTNWKMNKTVRESADYLSGFEKFAQVYSGAEYFVIPPYTHLSRAAEQLSGGPVRLGAQSSHWLDSGPYTGEISPAWLEELGLDLVELGHSERRQYYNENDFDLNKKVQAVLRHHMTALLCVGENAQEKAFGVTEEVLRRQLKIGLHRIVPEQGALWVAYEPVWAIGEQGIPAEPSYIERAHRMIERCLAELLGPENEIPLLYGGSVHPDNCAQMACLEHVNGLFIGRSAWDLTAFQKILEKLTESGLLQKTPGR